jgi:hypothetical protein
MVRLKVCPCFRLSGYEEFSEPVANRPWDAWHVLNDGKRFVMNYERDGPYFPTVLVWFRRLDEARQRFFQHVGATDSQESRRRMNQNHTQELHSRGGN